MKPANVFGYPKSQTPKFDMKKNNVELFKMTPLLIVFENNPKQEIAIIEIYTKGTVAWNPKNASVITMHKRGSRKTNFLSLNLCAANNAIPVIGATLGG